MSDEDENRFKAFCQGKEQMTRIAAKKLSRKYKNCTAYACDYCGKWHVGQGDTK